MLRTATLLALVSAAAVVAAPVPPPTEKQRLAQLWGKTEGGGTFELTGKRLTIRSAGQPARGLIGILGGGKTDRVNMPRATRAVAGDFEMTVTLVDAALPNKDAKHEAGGPNSRAGLFIEGGGYAIEFHLYQAFHKAQGEVQEEPQRCVWIDTWFPGGGSGSMLKAAEAGKSTHLRVARKDDAVSVSYSFDGENWSTPHTPRKELAFPQEVTVGVFLSHSTYQTLDATFDGFAVQKAEEKK